MPLRWLGLVLGMLGVASSRGAEPAAAPSLEREVLSLLKARCVKCHGPAKREGKLNLATPRGIARGGKGGAVVLAGKVEESPLWEKVDTDEMPPKEPLAADEKVLLRRWVELGAPGLPAVVSGEAEGADHWAFSRASHPSPPVVRDGKRVRTAIDRFIQAKLEGKGLALAPEADRATLVRRVSFDLTGLPPSPEEVRRFVSDPAPDAYEQMVERFLASPHYGERWGKYWLDDAGYTDSNGYFNADTDRPLAYRYRDYVIRSWNADKPLDRFIREQLAGDELAGFKAGGVVTPEVIESLVATHYLRNAPDGTGESDGNPDEVRADRYAVLEGATQVMGSSLFGLTFQCARCHDHKFEPVTQKDYYQLYAILWPAFDLERWVKPQARVVEAPLPGELAAWEERASRLDREIAALKAEFTEWARRNREKGVVRFRDEFDTSAPLSPRWSATAPGDNAPAGPVAVNVDSATPPGALIEEGALRIVESGGGGNRWLSTRQAFDWTPDEPGSWVQVTFDLLDNKIGPGGKPAERVAYYLALHDYDDSGPVSGGNILIDGNPAGGAAVHVDYPGADSQSRGDVGGTGYAPGRNYGVRVTNRGEDQFVVEHVVDGVPEEKTVTLSSRDLPDGGFGFEYCCGRSFIVDNVLIESGTGASSPVREQVQARRKALDEAVRAKTAARGDRPGKIAWVADLSTAPSATHLLKRGIYHDQGPKVEPAPPAVLSDPDNPFDVKTPDGTASTGRRLAFARWLTRPGSRPSALLARVLVNRLWQHHFGTGLVTTPDNLGYSGALPSHSELLEYLAAELAGRGWRAKEIHRLILNSAVYRQSSAPRGDASRADPDNQLFGRFPVLRLDAEALRDALLAVSGELDPRLGGPYVPARRTEAGEVVAENSGRRSVYLQQRRTQVVSLLDVFDAPSLVTNCTRRNASAIPLQSLSLLNSDFALGRARAFAGRIKADAKTPDERVARAFVVALGRSPTVDERAAAARFLEAQPRQYPGQPDAADRAWDDFCQMIMASNAFLYVD
ncbi:MAG: PSD1 and planctomycete cytochrome C domain-containing protein [Isosphaeraceae bacterium]|nr:PSD1 and planctomycete cytochrome C domain-containing protein [Isosphaeraceae bacterium]